MLTPGSFCTARELSTPSQDTHAQGRSFSEGPQSAKESFLLRSLPNTPNLGQAPLSAPPQAPLLISIRAHMTPACICIHLSH